MTEKSQGTGGRMAGFLRRRRGAERFFDHWAPDYEQSLRDYSYAVPDEIFQAAWPHLRLREGTLRLLDIGIGTGLCSAPFRASGRFHITGVDASARMLARCRATGVADELYRVDIERDPLPFPPQSFDAVIAGGLVEFIADPEYLFEEIAGVLRPQGIVVLTYETPETKGLYTPGLFDGVLDDQPDRVVISRSFTRRLWPFLYRKYLFDPGAIDLGLQLAGLVTMSSRRFVAYRWSGNREILYEVVTAKKLS